MTNDVEIARLVADSESSRVERTESVSDSDKFCKAICAFANDMLGNDLPGFLFIGVDKKGEPTGAMIDERLLETLAHHRSNGQIIPLPSMEVYKATYKGQDIAVVEVSPSDMPPVRYKNQVWIRVGPTARIASAQDERRLTERRIDRARTWDLQACMDATLDDLALDLFSLSYLPQAVSRQVLDENQRSIEDQLGSLRFYNSRLRVPTNGAVLLFGRDPEYFFPGAYVQYVRYTGSNQATDVEVEQRLSGDLVQVMRGIDQLAQSVAETHPLRQADLSDKLVYRYPPIALHELMTNAIIHRNYEGSTTPVTINHFSDRIEILNPGSLYGDLTAEQFPQGVSYRNPLLAEAAKVLGFANRFGRGIALAQDALAKNDSPALEYVVGENHMLMTVRKRP